MKKHKKSHGSKRKEVSADHLGFRSPPIQGGRSRGGRGGRGGGRGGGGGRGRGGRGDHHGDRDSNRSRGGGSRAGNRGGGGSGGSSGSGSGSGGGRSTFDASSKSPQSYNQNFPSLGSSTEGGSQKEN